MQEKTVPLEDLSKISIKKIEDSYNIARLRLRVAVKKYV